MSFSAGENSRAQTSGILTGGWAATLLAATPVPRKIRCGPFYSATTRYISPNDAAGFCFQRSVNEGETDRVILQKFLRTHHMWEGLRLNDLLQCDPAANYQCRAFQHHQLFLLEFGEQSAHRLTRGSDDFCDFFMRQRHLHLR